MGPQVSTGVEIVVSEAISRVVFSGGGLIHAAWGSKGGSGGFLTNRSGWVA